MWQFPPSLFWGQCMSVSWFSVSFLQLMWDLTIHSFSQLSLIDVGYDNSTPSLLWGPVSQSRFLGSVFGQAWLWHLVSVSLMVFSNRCEICNSPPSLLWGPTSVSLIVFSNRCGIWQFNPSLVWAQRPSASRFYLINVGSHDSSPSSWAQCPRTLTHHLMCPPLIDIISFCLLHIVVSFNWCEIALALRFSPTNVGYHNPPSRPESSNVGTQSNVFIASPY